MFNQVFSRFFKSYFASTAVVMIAQLAPPNDHLMTVFPVRHRNNQCEMTKSVQSEHEMTEV